MYNTKTLRGTIFCAPVKYNKEIVAGLNTVIVDYMPILVRDANILPVIPSWQMISPDETEVLLFNGDKIDLVKNINTEIDDAVIKSFSEHCKTVFVKIMELTGYACTRLALAPSVVISENGTRPDALYERLFGLKEFQNARPDISNVSQVFRVIKSIGGKDIKINHVANFHVENDVVTQNGRNQLRERYLCDFDINTMVSPDYRFGIDEVKEFFSIIPDSYRDYYNLYFAV